VTSNDINAKAVVAQQTETEIAQSRKVLLI
jgi:hypothetical protein